MVFNGKLAAGCHLSTTELSFHSSKVHRGPLVMLLGLYSWEIAATSGERLMSQGFQLGFQISGLEVLQAPDCFFRWSRCSVFLSFFVSGLSLPHTQPVLCNQCPSGECRDFLRAVHWKYLGFLVQTGTYGTGAGQGEAAVQEMPFCRNKSFLLFLSFCTCKRTIQPMV